MSAILPILLIAIFGWFGGIAVNYFSDVLPYSRKLSKPQCLHCEETLGLKQYLFSWRKCSHCQNARMPRAWVVEVSFIFIALLLRYFPQQNLGFLVAFAMLVYFASVVVMDIEHRVILHPVSLVGAFLMSAVGIWHHGLIPTFIGGVAGFGILFILYYFGDKLAHWIAKRRNQEFDDVALGFGDVNLAGVIGLLMGWPAITGGLFVGITAGGIYSFFYIVYKLITRSYSAFSTIPYGPFLVFGAVFLVYLQDLLIA